MDSEILYRQIMDTESRKMEGGRRGNGSIKIIITTIAAFICTFIVGTVESACTLAVTELWAYNNPSTERFTDSYTKYLTSDKGSLCQWLIISSHKEEVVELYFSDYSLKNSSGKTVGDCLYVYDGRNISPPISPSPSRISYLGPSNEDHKILGLCSGKPRHTYISSGREMLVVYRRGKIQGDRGFSMTFVSKEVLSREKMIRIAGIIGACIAALVLAFITLRATRCCRCLRQSKDEGVGGSRDIGGSTLVASARERDRLTLGEGGGGSELSLAAEGMRREARRVQGSAGSIDRLGVSGNPAGGVGDGSVSVAIVSGGSVTANGAASDAVASPSAPLATNEEDGLGNAASVSAAEGGHPHNPPDRQSSSLSSSSRSSRAEEEVNELPPSYESLFLDENGDYPTEKPPDYSPPRHRSKHPPRRVHTFN